MTQEIRNTLQSAKEQSLRVEITTGAATLRGRVLDLDGSDCHVLVDERDRRRVHVGHIVRVTTI